MQTKFIEKKPNRIIRALMDNFDTISVYFELPVDFDEAIKISFFKSNSIADFSIKYIHDTRLVIRVDYMNVKHLHYIGYEDERLIVMPHGVLDTRVFLYNGDDLGLSYTKEQSTFKVFAPTAMDVRINIYDNLEGDNKTTYLLKEENHGVWTIKINENLLGKFYAFNVFGRYPEFRGEVDVVDPYAKCVIARTHKAMVIDEASYEKVKPLDTLFHNERSIVYEINARDISKNNSSGTNKNGKFSAFSTTPTWLNGNSNTGIPTLVSHMKELGINTIQIMPLQEFDNDEADPNSYEWGYMPRYFNTPDGSFASNWRDDSKIHELKAMMNVLHENNFRVTLDVVYNHTAEGFFGEGIYSFNAFVPYFYYRFGNGHISNGSGCGNELRTEGFMIRKFIVDSLVFWTQFYGFDGYRFDLMGLIDVDTMVEIVNSLKMIKPDIFIYGEPWTAGLTPIQPTYKGAQRDKGFSSFNDDFRDAIKGAVFHSGEKGFVQTKGYDHHDRVIQGILGSINTFASQAVESMNYVEVHDNNTLFDKLVFTQSGRDYFEHPQDNKLLKEIKAMHKLSAFILLVSQGVPVLHLGQDFMRTKDGVENSYNSGDHINAIHWERKQEFHDVFCYYKNLITIRKSNQLFMLNNANEIRDAIEFCNELFPEDKRHGIAFKLESKNKHFFGAKDIAVFINPYHTRVPIELRETGWKILMVGDDYYGSNPIEIEKDLELPKLSGTILVRL